MDRRNFLKGTLIAAPGVALLGPAEAWAQSKDYGSDVDILNFALIAEYFLSQFYREGGPQMSGKESRYIESISADEDGHIAAITKTIQNLGGTPTQAPAIDFGKAMASRKNFLEFAFKFENIFSGAYLNAAGAIKNKEILQAAAGIFGVEERHAAIVGRLLGRSPTGGVYVGAFSKPVTKAATLRALAPYLKGAKAAAGGAAITT